jgi:hypothetical protein
VTSGSFWASGTAATTSMTRAERGRQLEMHRMGPKEAINMKHAETGAPGGHRWSAGRAVPVDARMMKAPVYIDARLNEAGQRTCA